MSRHPFSRRSRRRIRKGPRRYLLTSDPAKVARLMRSYLRKHNPRVYFTGRRIFWHQPLSKRVRGPRRTQAEITAWVRLKDAREAAWQRWNRSV